MTQNSVNNTASDLTIDNLFVNDNTISSTNTNGDIILAPDGTGVVSVTEAPITPSGDRVDSLGSATNSWNNVYAEGITFDGGVNVFSNYVDSTAWTPILVFGGGTTGITYATQEGSYIIVGDVIFIKFHIVLTSKGTDVGNADITNIPFTTSTDSTPSTVQIRTDAATTSSNRTQFYGQWNANTTFVRLVNIGSNVNSNMNASNFANDTEVAGSGFHFIN